MRPPETFLDGLFAAHGPPTKNRRKIYEESSISGDLWEPLGTSGGLRGHQRAPGAGEGGPAPIQEIRADLRKFMLMAFSFF